MASKRALRGATGLLLAAVLAAGCGDAGTGSPVEPGPHPPAPPPAGGPLTAAQRESAITAVEDFLVATGAAQFGGDAFAAAVRQYLATRPEFEAHGVDDSESVWARFRDGRLLIIANNREPGAAADEDAAAAVQLAGALQVAGAGSAELPVPRQVRLLHSFGPNFEQVQAPVRDLADRFTAAGYTVAPGNEGDARVDILRNVSGDGFFYFNTHGGKGRTREGHDVFAMQTSSMASAATDNLPDFKDDLDNGRLVYMTAKNGGKLLGGLIDDWDTRYAITHLFVDRYMSFGQNSILFFNVCYSGNANSDISSFVFAAHKKGAGFYIGWSKAVSVTPAFNAVRYFADRMLGANAFRAEDPRQRPFDLNAVLEDMTKKGLTTDASSGAELVLRPAVAGTNGLLTPTIHALEPAQDGADFLTVHGRFGADPGASARSVTVGGQAMTVQEWTPDEITIPVPRTDAGSSGDVVVTVRGVRSNARALVAWRGRMKFTLRSQGSLSQNIEFDLHLRGDPDRGRQRPGDSPVDLQQPFSIQPILGGTGSYSASGSHTWLEPGDPCPWTETWSGSGSMVYGPNDTGRYGLLYGGPIQGEPRVLKLTLIAFGTQEIRVRGSAPCDSDFSAPSGFMIPRELFDGGISLDLKLDSSFNIMPGKVERSVKGPFRDERTSTATLEWDAIPAQPAPAQDQKK
jgi:hypothetical protein